MAEVKIGYNFKYLVVQTGYTARLVKHAKEINKKINEMYDSKERKQRLLYIHDPIWGEGYYDFSNDKESLTELKKRVKDYKCGSIAFLCKSLGGAMSICDIIMEYKYCDFFSFLGLGEIVCRGDIIIMHFDDCESGTSYLKDTK